MKVSKHLSIPIALVAPLGSATYAQQGPPKAPVSEVDFY